MRRARSCAAILAALAPFIAPSTAATAQDHEPVLRDLTVAPWPIPATGGTVTLRFHARYTATCRIAGFSSPFRCSGWVSHALDWPASRSASERTFLVTIAAD